MQKNAYNINGIVYMCTVMGLYQHSSLNRFAFKKDLRLYLETCSGIKHYLMENKCHIHIIYLIFNVPFDGITSKAISCELWQSFFVMLTDER